MVYGDSNSIRQAHHFQRRAPKRLTITIQFTVFSSLEKRSTGEGRSLSNLAAYLIENALKDSLPGGRAENA